MPVKYLDGIQSTKSCKCVRGLTHVSADEAFYNEAYPKCACVAAKTLAVDPLSSDHSKNGGF